MEQTLAARWWQWLVTHSRANVSVQTLSAVVLVAGVAGFALSIALNGVTIKEPPRQLPPLIAPAPGLPLLELLPPSPPPAPTPRQDDTGTTLHAVGPVSTVLVTPKPKEGDNDRPALACLTAEARGLLGHIERRFGRVQVVSTCRPGAFIAGTRRPSLHRDGRAVDFEAPAGQKEAVVAWLIENHKAGGTMTYKHYSHIHVDIGAHFVSLQSGAQSGGRITSRKSRCCRARTRRVRYDDWSAMGLNRWGSPT